MSENPYKAPEFRSDAPKTTDPQASFIDSKSLWILFEILGFIPVLAAFRDGGSGTVTGDRFLIGLSTVLLCEVGIRLKWGPMIPCMMISVCFLVATAPATSAWFDHPVEFFGGMFGGGAIGYIFDSRRKTSDRND